jgi:hypothetical protein
MLSLREVERLRAQRCLRQGKRKVRTQAEAADFINEVGFATLMGVPEMQVPDLSAASVNPGWHVDSSKWWWGWKQTLPGKKACFYAKILRGRGTFISWQMFPYFFAVNGDKGPYEEEWTAGLVSRDEKRILDILSSKGPMLTDALRLAFGPRGKSNTAAFHRALGGLQSRFRVTVCGGDLSGWSMHRWALVEDWAPRHVMRKARRASLAEALEALVLRLLENVVIAAPADIAWLFSWPRATAQDTARSLISKGLVVETKVKGLEGRYLALARAKSSG